jgi:hypothetical protein
LRGLSPATASSCLAKWRWLEMVIADLWLCTAYNVFSHVSPYVLVTKTTWVWVKIKYPNNWMVNTKLD